MRLLTFRSPGGQRAGAIAADSTVVAVADLVAGAPDDVVGVIEAGAPLWTKLRSALASARGGAPLEKTTLLAPIPRPRRNVFCVGWNYADHFQEGKDLRPSSASGAQEIPERPALFSKNPATVTGPDAAVWHPAPYSEQLDWEAELAVIVGTGGRDIAEDRAMRHVFGYTCANDVSVRDVQQKWHGVQWFKGKNFDTHLPLGPWIVTTDELDAGDLAIRSRVNGVTKQDSRTKFMVFKVGRILSELSAGLELVPGDVIITGTPSGVGFARKPPEWLKVGDTVEVDIEGIGVLRNRIEGRR